MTRFLILSSLILLAQSCEIYSDDKKTDPRNDSVSYLHHNVLGTVAGTIKMADFFDSYQKIREDREASLLLLEEYYGDRFYEGDLTYESFDRGYEGVILLTEEPGLYRVDYFYENRIIYNVSSLGGRRYHITTAAAPKTKMHLEFRRPEFSIGLECVASIDEDDTINIESLDMKYMEISEEKTLAAAHITSESARIHMRMGDAYHEIPFAGILNYSITGDKYTDSFSVEYHDENYSIL